VTSFGRTGHLGTGRPERRPIHARRAVVQIAGDAVRIRRRARRVAVAQRDRRAAVLVLDENLLDFQHRQVGKGAQRPGRLGHKLAKLFEPVEFEKYKNF